jgi:hypothetical protein
MGGFYKKIYTLCLKFALCAHLFPLFSIMYLRLTPNLWNFLPDFGALYALRHAPNFYEIHSRSCMSKSTLNQSGLCQSFGLDHAVLNYIIQFT